ncbi:MAG: hypothetical protein JSV92_02640 [archaeon]|nr:MAG: hypothetical protein JSV92_02640 [archaeon]
MAKKTPFLLSLLLVFLLTLAQARGVSLGAAPGVMQIGELEPGREYAVDFYLVTNSRNDLVTSLDFIESRRSMFDHNVTGRYTFIPAEASEEDMSEWLSFLREKVVVSNRESFSVRFPDGSIVNANEKVTIIMDVPPDAEPGYHTYEVVLKPKLSSGGSGTGVSTIGITRPFFIFKIPGVAKREGVIEGVAGSRNGDRAAVDVLFRNSGTVTMSARVSSLKVYNETGYYVGTYDGGYVMVPPKNTGILKVFWRDLDTNEQKNIKIEATVDYLTGKVTKETMVTIPRAGVTARMEVRAEEFPWWIVILIIGLILLYIYWRRR